MKAPRVVLRRVGELKPYARNARTHSAEQVEQIARSITEFGWTTPILLDGKRGIIAGHGRLPAAQKLGLAQVPCIELAHLSKEQRRALVIADNQLALNAGWDPGVLKLEIGALKADGFDLSLLGFSLDAIGGIMADNGEGLTDPDDVPAKPKKPVSRTGDLWLLGRHRLLCGDSTDPGDVARVTAQQKAVLMQTDPPYGIGYVSNAKTKGQSRAHENIENDDLDGRALQAFLEQVIRTVLPHLKKGAAFYLWHPMLTQGTFFAAAAADILIHRQIIWAKPSMVFGRGDYHWQHELCFYGWIRGNRPAFYGERNQTTLWSIGRETSKDHPTAKPVALWAPPIHNHTKAGDLIYEPFAGSGSQVIAAEMTGRSCLAIEIAPEYVDVAVLRWQAFTGQAATLEGDGRTFDEIARAGREPGAKRRGRKVAA